MPAQILETNTTPLQRVPVDAVTLDIIENALRNARVEMDATLFRTALSPGIREQGDAFPLIAERTGKMVAGQFGSFIDGFLRNYDGEIEEGDVILVNDPYSVEGAISHANDVLAISPIYRGGRLIAWSAMFGHMTDIGGKVPGSLPTDATSIFEEGFRLPPVKLYRKGVLQGDILKIAAHQSRMPDWFRADLHAIVASCRVAGRRLAELSERFGDDVLASAMDELLERNRRAMGQLIKTAIGEAPVSFEDYICDDGAGAGPFKIKCTMHREDERVILDFAGTDPQSSSSINFYLNENMFKMFFGIYMIMVFDPQIMFNDGFYDLVDVRIPEGSLLKPRFPAALSCRTHALGRIFDVLGALLGQKAPEFLCAAGFSSSPHLMFSGYDRKGEWFQLFQIGFGGIPGRPFGDGADGHSLWPGFTNVPNEFLERYFPMVIERYVTVPDSGGAGRFRGGNGIHMTYRFTEAGTIAIHDAAVVGDDPVKARALDGDEAAPDLQADDVRFALQRVPPAAAAPGHEVEAISLLHLDPVALGGQGGRAAVDAVQAFPGAHARQSAVDAPRRHEPAVVVDRDGSRLREPIGHVDAVAAPEPACSA